MSVEDRTETISVAIVAMFIIAAIAAIAAIAVFGYVFWAETTADVIILHDDGQSYACQTSRITPAPHDCKPVKERRS